ncbi:hypothetical protein BOTBODRAFT_354212 [Botryobasidium botryosum FD-172 SS1]|uniref:Pre-rRNA-processing protein TSR2 n=1 Tax=Botryobasidium botryosum (strain FD-172 SS1) TaxID=930990 RepID=A0A067MRL2_BOTB1|nr:hypothetical protein BOTBODRAFT_354212 [Botryobasidium botryosum FD-172 SS1]
MSSSIAESPTPSAVAPKLVLFARGVIAILSVWPVLRLAVDQNWGGPESAAKRTYLASEIVDAFESASRQLNQDDVEDLVLQALAEEFEVVVEDGSSEKVARDVVRLWAEVSEGKTDMVISLEAIADKIRGKKVVAEVEEGNGDSDWEDDESGEEDGDDDAPQLIAPQTQSSRPEPVVDEDGFTLVQGKGKK